MAHGGVKACRHGQCRANCYKCASNCDPCKGILDPGLRCFATMSGCAAALRTSASFSTSSADKEYRLRGQPVCNARYGMGNLTSLRMTVSLMLDPVSWLARLVSIYSTASFSLAHALTQASMKVYCMRAVTLKSVSEPVNCLPAAQCKGLVTHCSESTLTTQCWPHLMMSAICSDCRSLSQ